MPTAGGRLYTFSLHLPFPCRKELLLDFVKLCKIHAGNV